MAIEAGLRADDATLVTQVIDNPHHEIHDGASFFYKGKVDLALSAVLDIQITVADTTTWPHLELLFSSEAECNYFVYENVTIVTPGTAVTPLNRNRNSAATAGMVVKAIENASLVLANADTTVAGGTLIEEGVVGAGVLVGGSSNSRKELILKQNEDYAIRFEGVAAGYVDYLLDWYEHKNIL